jgi:hypothetical protein
MKARGLTHDELTAVRLEMIIRIILGLLIN